VSQDKDLETQKQRMQEGIRALQDRICAGLEAFEPSVRFREDPWERPGGGGGRTRVMEEGEVFEKAGVNTSIVHGELEEAFARRLQGDGRSFWAGGLSLVIHPRSPMVPTVHANFRLIHQGTKAWIGGGIDLTPHYLFEDDVRHFHQTLKGVCDAYDSAWYPRFKAHCDRYFFNSHRDEARGVGGIFYEDVGGPLERDVTFNLACGEAFLASYVPIVERRKDLPTTPDQRAWQEIRRGRYAEFNLLHDRGTVFGLQTRGRTESILMSLPPRVRWVYDHHPEPGSEEARMLEVLKAPRDWA